MSTTHTASPPPGAQPLGATLRRSSTDRILLGLCAGIARSTGASSLAVRLGTLAVGVFLLPLVLIAYVVSAVILPRDDGMSLIGSGPRERRDMTIAMLCALVAAPAVIGAAAAYGFTSWSAIGPLLALAAFIGVGIALFGPSTQTTQQPRPVTAPSSHPFQGTTAWPVEPGATMSRQAADPSAATAAFSVPRGVPGGIPGGVPGGLPGAATGDTEVPPPAAGPDEPDQARRRGLALPIFAVLGLVMALFTMLLALGVVDFDWDTWAILLAALAVGAAAGAVAVAILRPSWLATGFLMIVAACLAASAVGVHQFGDLFDDGFGERLYTPTTVSELRSDYRLGGGALDLDLRDIAFAPGSTTVVRATLGFGELRVAVPEGVRVRTTADSTLSISAQTGRKTPGGPGGRTADVRPVILLDLSMRGAETSILAGKGSRLENLERLATESGGFWSDGRSSERQYRSVGAAAFGGLAALNPNTLGALAK